MSRNPKKTKKNEALFPRRIEINGDIFFENSIFLDTQGGQTPGEKLIP